MLNNLIDESEISVNVGNDVRNVHCQRIFFGKF